MSIPETVFSIHRYLSSSTQFAGNQRREDQLFCYGKKLYRIRASRGSRISSSSADGTNEVVFQCRSNAVFVKDMITDKLADDVSSSPWLQAD
jgi:hypothetical protein